MPSLVEKGKMMNTRSTLRRTVAVFAVAAATAGVTAFAAGTAVAMPTDFECTSGQLATRLVDGGGVGNRQAAVQLTAKPGVSCILPGSLPVDLTGAHSVLIGDNAPVGAPSVWLSDGASAYIPLRWTALEPYADQQTPLAITVTAPQQVDPRGDHSDPVMTVDWNLGAVDATAASHVIDVGAVTPGLAPTA
jgi:hypothetical protein